MHLYEALSQSVKEWRQQGYPHGEYDTISEILDWASNPEGEGFRLRPPQLRALETYWYLRLIKDKIRIQKETIRKIFSECQKNSRIMIR